MHEAPWFLNFTAAAAAVTVVFFVAESIRALPTDAESRNRALPGLWRIVWPLLAPVGIVIRPMLSASTRLRLQRALSRAGLDRVLAPQHIASASLLCATVPLPATLAVEQFGVVIPLWLTVAASAMAALWPGRWLVSTIRARSESLLRGLPFLIELLAMAVESGLPLPAALAQSVERLPAGPLRDECRRIVRDVKAGMPRDEALRALSARLEIAAVTQFVMAVIAAQRDGGAIVKVLRAQADQQRNDRFLLAERRAAQAPVRVLFPLVVFIFPGTLAVVLFPVVSRMLSEVSRWQ